MPSPFVATKRSRILCDVHTVRLVWSNHLDAHLSELGIECVAVICAIADKTFRELFYESRTERIDDELCFMALATRNPDGDRKTMAVCHCHDLGRLAASSFANKKAPFFAPA